MGLVKNLKGIGTARMGQRDVTDYSWVGKKLEALFEAEDQKQIDQWVKTQDYFRPSSLTYKWSEGMCPRYWHYIFNNQPRVGGNNASDIARMGYGTHRHSILQEQFEKMDEFVEMERPLTNENPTIKGSCDLVMKVDGEEIIGEIKTTKHESWIRRQIEGPPHYNILQVCLYMHMSGCEKGFILIENNNTREVLLFPVEYTDELRLEIQELFKWMRLVEKTVKEDKLLPERAFTKGSYNCKGCPFKKQCWNVDGDGDINIPASPAYGEVN